MYPGCLFSIVELVGNDLFAISVGEEVDRPRWYNTNKCGSQALKERTRRLLLIDIPNYMNTLAYSRTRMLYCAPKNVTRLYEMP